MISLYIVSLHFITWGGVMNKPYAYYEHKKLNNFKELLTLNLENKKDEVAFIFNNAKKEEIKKTYNDFYNDVTLMSNYLSNNYKNKHIALIGENSYNYLVLFFSIIISKNVAVLIDKDLSKEKIQELLKKSDSKVLFYSKDYCDIDGLEKKYKSYFIEDLEKIIKTSKDLSFKDNKAKNECRVIFFTSGTTGANKGVMLSEKNILSDIYGASSLFKPDGLVFSCLPFHHAFGLITSILKPFYYGVPVFLNHSLKYLTNELKSSAPNTMFVVPVFIENFYKQIWKNARLTKKDYMLKTMIKLSNSLLKVGIDLRSYLFKSITKNFGGNLKYIICGGAFLDKKYVKWFRSIGIEILNGYGITECSPVLAVNRNEYYKDGSVGQVVRGATIKIENNEILVKGDIVMLGYYKDEQATKEVMKKGYFNTGDFGYLDEEGFLYITGRKKNLIILSNGENISPEVIEEKLSKDKGVCEVIVYEKDNKLIASIYPVEEYFGNTSYFNGLIYKYNSKVPKNHQISSVTLRTEEFPKNNNRKILRSKVMEEEK
jgi:AMP-dependent synthetase/ligase